MTDFGQALAATTLELRDAAESAMIDTVTIDRPGARVPDGLGGDTVSMTRVYEGRAKVQGRAVQEASPEAGGHSFTVQRYEVQIPVSAPLAHVDDVVVVTAAALDPNLVTTRFRVAALLHKTYATAQRLAVEQTVA